MTRRALPFPLSPPVLLAPMAGITDLPTRQLVAGFGAGMVVSEMVASQEFLTERPGAREKTALGLGVAGTAVQLAGREAAPMAEAARRVAGQGATIIDINMGCPAKKVTQGASGSALMRTPDHALRLIEAVVGAVDVPVTLKTRLGWDDALKNAADIARRAQDAGIAMITVHGRTRCQFYRGAADWAAIRAVHDAVDIPVIANGDILDTATARTALTLSGAQGIMVGRAARGQPWLLAQIAHDIFGTPAPVIPRGRGFADMVEGHFDALLAFYGAPLGLRVARKHLGWYMDRCATPPDLRRAVLTQTEPGRMPALIRAATAADPARAAA